jgi:predicted ATPase
MSQDDCRLLSLIGPGGVGKTRLAQRAMRELAPGYSDGVAFVSLEDVASPDELGGRLAREIGVGLAGSAEPLDQVIKFLRSRHMQVSNARVYEGVHFRTSTEAGATMGRQIGELAAMKHR